MAFECIENRDEPVDGRALYLIAIGRGYVITEDFAYKVAKWHRNYLRNKKLRGEA
jgi:hypothetical protein